MYSKAPLGCEEFGTHKKIFDHRLFFQVPIPVEVFSCYFLSRSVNVTSLITLYFNILEMKKRKRVKGTHMKQMLLASSITGRKTLTTFILQGLLCAGCKK